MGLLVNKDATFKIEFNYREIHNALNQSVGIEIFDHEMNDTKLFSATFCQANFEEMSLIREEATLINHINEKPLLLLRIFCPKVISTFCRDWNVCDENGRKYPINENLIKCLPEHFVMKIVEQWAIRTGHKDLLANEVDGNSDI
jgi:hypothetical protein